MSSEIETRARISLQRIQAFDTSTLPREARLGEDLNFLEAVEPANHIVDLFRQIPLDALTAFPQDQLNNLTSNADSAFQLLNQIVQFDPKSTANAFETRRGMIDTIKNSYAGFFNAMQLPIAYAASRLRDFDALERGFRAAMQRAEDSAAEAMSKLQAQQGDAQKVLEEIRQIAAEQGVSQQASYFKTEADRHEGDAHNWRFWTITTACVLVAYAALSAFLHKWEWLAPKNNYETIQLALSKVLIFAVFAYVLLLCARNFLSSKHNAIVNKHRQNALLTFNALVEAAATEERRDVVLTYAAACIFSPQDTGFTKAAGGSHGEMPLNIIQAIPKLAGGGGGHA